MIEVLYNTKCGGYGLSEEACAEYLFRMKAYSKANIEDLMIFASSINYRTDPVMVGVFKDMRELFNSSHARIAIKVIPVKFEDYILIHEYNGKEEVTIDYTEYYSDQKRAIIHSMKIMFQGPNKSNPEQVRKIVNLIH